MRRDSSPQYWDEYTNLQYTKHMLIREYLKGWFPKLGFWSDRVVYLDTHAGRGEHKQGQAGSPIVALETLLQHSFRDRILRNSEARFFFIEHDAKNVEALQTRVDAVGELPDRVFVEVTAGDCFEQIENVLEHIETQGHRVAPAFVFVDPYGFKVPGDLLRRLLAVGRVELFVNVIWRELDMAMSQAHEDPNGGMAKTLDLVFGDDRWRTIDRTLDFNVRADETIDVLRETYSALWSTSLRMLGNNNETRYVLAHFTNHDDGRDLMKDCVWKICPDGGFYARRSDNPQQTRLIVPEPDLAPLAEWLIARLRTAPHRWSELKDALRGELWRNTHLWKVVRKCRNEGLVVGFGHKGRFSQKADPVLSLVEGK